MSSINKSATVGDVLALKGDLTPGERVDAARKLLEGSLHEVAYLAKDREHIIQMSPHDTQKLREWLERPSGSFGNGDVSFDACGGGILVRTQPYAVRAAREKAQQEAEAKYCKDSPTKQHNSVQAINGDTNESLGYRLCGYCGRREW